ncbi:hypothetical protein OG331_51695 [Streptomyces sp. NBC_01017]|uniref:hypothetical protein n=1 Tax=Streptomyces sp. NBC_01017 TaxID=2903721 RepID=UPI0038642C69|nr:hypothetical protein OG331_00275 [Streptomyces sp. NBC_01017]WSV35359.1 hypothetical protein OG331_51695 [Streptomyces sp. NBC_01017]
MTVIVESASEWLDTITAQARSAQAKVFSVSVPVSHPATSDQAHEHLLSAAIEGIEREGWTLDSMSTYGASSAYEGTAFWALLVFRTAYRGRV